MAAAVGSRTRTLSGSSQLTSLIAAKHHDGPTGIAIRSNRTCRLWRWRA